MPLVYDELRKLAAAKLAQEKPGQTLQATALVHEAYVRLVDVEKLAALEQPRPLLCAPRRRRCGEFWSRMPGDEPRSNMAATGVGRSWHPLQIAAPEVPDDLLALDEALEAARRT